MSSAIKKSRLERVRSLGDYSVLLFNTMFAMLSTVTLLGIIFITRPQQPMHDIPPHWWIPLAVVMIPGQLYAQYLSWNTVLRFRTPSPLEIAKGFHLKRWWMTIPSHFIGAQTS